MDFHLVTVCSFHDEFLAHLAVAKLKDKNIPSVLQNTDRFTMQNLEAIQLQVREEDLELAQTILEEGGLS